MAGARFAKSLKEQLSCPICMDYFKEPVTLGCGHSFCHLCLLRKWGEDDQPHPCPECERIFQLRDFECNYCLENLANIARHIKPYLLKIKEENTKCTIHEKDQELYCEEDQVFLCILCSATPEHRGHKVYFIEKAAEDSRENCQVQRKSMMAEYRRFYELLEKEQQLHLYKLEKQESDHLKRVREHETRLSQRLQSLKEVIGELQQHHQKLNVQFLQVIGHTLTRCESLLGYHPETVTTTPGNISSYTLIGEMLTHFKVDVTLDPESACPYLIVFDDLKTVVHGSYQRTVTFTPNQFKESIILGAQIFISGIYYWEVDVGDSWQWSVGICKESLRRDVNISSEDVSLLSYVRNGDLHTVVTIPPYFKCQVHAPIHIVGILLDCEEKTISFYDALRKSFIFRFPHFPFSMPIRPFFSPCPPSGELSGIPMILREV
ncbi:putative E3 ubiquitin-protein ligase TRIML1 [Macrotis lagotis]|uniref:putative E3 ubiquitin-protein ligase TRIML1 n=1 Tax=Macrotis lagotis TaxID=92651 RepID=UPI003D68B912